MLDDRRSDEQIRYEYLKSMFECSKKVFWKKVYKEFCGDIEKDQKKDQGGDDVKVSN